MNNRDLAGRVFLANPDLRLIDIPDRAALGAGERVRHAEMAQAIKDARREYRARSVGVTPGCGNVVRHVAARRRATSAHPR